MRARRTTTWAALAAVALGTLTGLTLAGAGPARARQMQAAPPTCQGRRATIVGSGADIRGTRRADVVVTNGATFVKTLGGDDRVCVTVGGAVVQAGTGADRVVNQTLSGAVSAKLGSGANRYVGGPGPDVVASGTRGARNTDRLFLGVGDDEVVAVLKPGDDLSVDAGVGRDRLVPATRGGPAGSWAIDNAAQQAVLDGSVVAHWSSVERFDLGAAGGTSQTFVGSAARDDVLLDAPRLVADLGAGDDRLQVTPSYAAQGALSGGEGRDQLVTYAATYVAGNLTTGALTFDPRSPAYSLAAFEDLTLSAREVRLTGDGGANKLRGWGCRVAAAGAKGRDLLWTEPKPELGWTCGRRTRYVLRGQNGDDRLIGWTGPDVLKGGRGRDYARGNGSRDRCVQVERRRSC